MNLKFTALEVGSGDAFLLEDNGKNILFDSGGNKQTIVKLLNKKGIKRIDLAICSHNDKDHSNGFLGLLNSKIEIGEIWLPSTWASVIHSVAGFMRRDCENCENIYCQNDNPLGCLCNIVFKERNNESYYDKLLSSREDISNDQLIADLHFINNVASVNGCLICCRNSENKDCKLYKNCYISKFCIDACGEYICHTHPPQKYRIGNLASESMIQLDVIISIAKEALKHGVNIRWFEPTKTCTKKNRVTDNIIVLNADESARTIRVTKIDRLDILMFALKLTTENEYSLKMEYLYNDIPVVRFSGDSDCTCQCSNPCSYSYNIIVTAPHHGSDANANVYKTIKGDNIIWVRSDGITKARPCSDFKMQNAKYCLACGIKKFGLSRKKRPGILVSC